MQFESIAITVIALAILVFLFARRHVITDLKAANDELRTQLARLRDVAQRQREEIDRLITTAENERRARQMATLSAIGSQAPRPSITKPKEWKDPDLARDPYKNSAMARKQDAATRAPTRQQDAPASTWEAPGMPYTPAIAPSPAPAPAYHGGGGSFDGGGASGDYGRSDSSACTSSASSSDSSSDSGSSSSCSSSDSGSSSSGSD